MILEQQKFGKWVRTAFALCVASLCAMVLISLCLIATGKNPLGILWAILYGAFGSVSGIIQTLTRAIPLLLCALGVAIPARAGLFNLGGEGQLHFGAIAVTAVVLYLPWLPDWTVIPTMIPAAMLAGALWAFIPGFLRARLGVNEILVGLMLNYVAIFVLEYLVHGPWKDTSPSTFGWPYSALFPESAILPTLGNSNVHLGLLIGLGAAALMYFVMRLTTWGFVIRLMEANPITARYCGINLQINIVVLMAIGGAFAALAGLGEVSVIQGRLRSGISPGYGYAGFLIAWLSQNNFLRIISVAILIGGLYSGADALQLFADLPSATTDIFMGVVYLSFLLGVYLNETINRRGEEVGKL